MKIDNFFISIRIGLSSFFDKNLNSIHRISNKISNFWRKVLTHFNLGNSYLKSYHNTLFSFLFYFFAWMLILQIIFWKWDSNFTKALQTILLILHTKMYTSRSFCDVYSLLFHKQTSQEKLKSLSSRITHHSCIILHQHCALLYITCSLHHFIISWNNATF